ncbi:MAG TPA: LL-diaminopimelate aminotransferase [Candidatus Borkfalkia avistercoris]|uniref:LL-diaminopimelate aminotransferase n=1 Tax=Candidatus Borkfalkia avistercoris TaxID=2838504 RepID=A0A9D2CYZ5_9FIRM|nr:LL-diaminopimelate aminotransferase [Candidatus Borkfalkia avistercoris]
MNLNTNYLKLNESYLFSTIAKKVNAYAEAHPDKKILRMGIGDVTLPLAPAVVTAMQRAAGEMGVKESFRGYGPEQGYPFLKNAIRGYYAARGISLEEDEIFVSDGAKSDVGNILDIFARENTVLVPDPVYPVYVDTNVMAGRKILYADATEKNGFLPMPDENADADIIYICSPNNPTGAAYSAEQLAEWVAYARKRGAVILYDAAYEAFVAEKGLARSIFEVEGAKECAIEFCSLSKTAGFTGTRCGYTVVPRALVRGGVSLNKLWLRRQTTKFNGVSYIVQRGAEAVFTEEGMAQIQENLAVYRRNAAVLSACLDALGIFYTGGRNSPYIWLKCPGFADSWKFFDYLLEEANVVGTPGSGFGKNGEGFFRLTAFASEEATAEAAERLKILFSK